MSKSAATSWLFRTRKPFPRALIYIISPDLCMSTLLGTLQTWGPTMVIPALRRCQPFDVGQVLKIANEGKPSRIRWKLRVSESLLCELGNEPKNQAPERRRKKEVGPRTPYTQVKPVVTIAVRSATSREIYIGTIEDPEKAPQPPMTNAQLSS